MIGELKNTSAITLLLICLSSVAYEAMEGWVTYSFAKKYNKKFTYQMAESSVYYASFYRVATLGSAGGIAAIHYLHKYNIPVSCGTGFYTLGYALHKGAIVLFSMITFLLCAPFMFEHYKQYGILLISGYVIMLLITIGLILFCCYERCHRILIAIANKCNSKGKFDKYVDKLKEECRIMEHTSKNLMRNPLFVIKIIAIDLAKNFFWYIIPYLIVYETGAFSILESLAITSLGVVLAAVIPTPAGIGGTEYILTMLLAVFVGTAKAGSTALLFRFATFLVPFFIGMVLVVIQKIKKYRKK